MDEIVVVEHNFEKAQKQLKRFSKKTAKELEFPEIKIEGGFLGLGNHKVTGIELDGLITIIQGHLIDFNKLHTKFIKEFGHVYNALEALDKDYINVILESLKRIKMANEKADIAQKDIQKAIDLQKKTILVLNQFKEKIESYSHYADVDRLWDDTQNMRDEILLINDNIAGVKEAVDTQLRLIEVLNEFKASLEKYVHLGDIDILWEQFENAVNEISAVNEKMLSVFSTLQNHGQSIALLLDFKDKLDSYEHLEDIDFMWGRCDVLESESTEAKEMLDTHKERIEELQNTLQEMQNQNDERSLSFSKKLRIAYALAGCSLGFAVVELALLIMGMM